MNLGDHLSNAAKLSKEWGPPLNPSNLDTQMDTCFSGYPERPGRFISRNHLVRFPGIS